MTFIPSSGGGDEIPKIPNRQFKDYIQIRMCEKYLTLPSIASVIIRSKGIASHEKANLRRTKDAIKIGLLSGEASAYEDELFKKFRNKYLSRRYSRFPPEYPWLSFTDLNMSNNYWVRPSECMLSAYYSCKSPSHSIPNQSFFTHKDVFYSERHYAYIYNCNLKCCVFDGNFYLHNGSRMYYKETNLFAVCRLRYQTPAKSPGNINLELYFKNNDAIVIDLRVFKPEYFEKFNSTTKTLADKMDVPFSVHDHGPDV